MEEIENNSLLILGNGFDLNCKIYSSFEHFFKSISKESNIWYILFDFAFTPSTYVQNHPFISKIKENEVLWMDVEDFIKRILFMHRDENKSSQLLRQFGCGTYLEVLHLCYLHRNDVMFHNQNLQIIRLKDFFIKTIGDSQPGTPPFNIIEFLKNQLFDFEEDFKQYISKISTDNKEYIDNSSLLLKELCDREESYDILTFNYTLPDKLSVEYYSYGKINHIHGSVTSNIIIGFDSSNISEDAGERITLSKAFQKLFLKEENSKLTPKDKIQFVKFYGHSLGSQDYSYFHAIFDYYDIYNNSNIQWVFYYTPYKETDEENNKVREEYISNVYALLNNYWYKSGRNEKINSLVNRLLLENRLIIDVVAKL